MMRRSFAICIAVIALFAGCGTKPDGSNVSAVRPPSSHIGDRTDVIGHPPSPTADNAGVIAISLTGTCPVTGDFEGVFTSPNDMVTYLQCVIPAVDAWIDTVYTHMPHPSGYYLVPSGITTVGKPGCEYDTSQLLYCKPDDAIYLGVDAVWDQYHNHGDASLPLIVAHEITHHFQVVSGMPRALTSNAQIRYENQADCGAGAFMAYARAKGFMAPDDLNDLGSSLASAGETDGPDRSHGTIQERISSFGVGYYSPWYPSLISCNQFVPEIPLVDAHP